MSEDIFDKLDSLMNKHRGEEAVKAETSVPETPALETSVPVAEPDIPVLTEEVPEEALRTSPIPVLTEVVEEGGETLELSAALLAEVVAEEVPPPVEEPVVESEPFPDPLAGLEQRVTEAVENYVAPRLASKLDLALGELLEQFRGEIEHMVKDAVARELQQYLDTLGDDQHSPH
jgi:hypothetical protein